MFIEVNVNQTDQSNDDEDDFEVHDPSIPHLINTNSIVAIIDTEGGVGIQTSLDVLWIDESYEMVRQLLREVS